MQPEFRLATEADLEATFQVYLAANQDLNRRIGRQSTLRNIRCQRGRSPFAGMPFATIRNVFGLLNLAKRLAGLGLRSGADHSGTLRLCMYCPNSKVAESEACWSGAALEISTEVTGRSRF